MTRDIARQFVVVVSTVAVIVMNILANTLPLNGLNTGEISDRFDVYFVPAGYVFSIWGLIYIGLIAYTVYQALPSQRENPALRKIGYWYVLSCAANITWLFLWHYEVFNLTLLPMLALLASLIVIYLRLGIGTREVSPAERWSVHATFSLYLGWITVATIANATQLLDYLGWGAGDQRGNLAGGDAGGDGVDYHGGVVYPAGPDLCAGDHLGSGGRCGQVPPGAGRNAGCLGGRRPACSFGAGGSTAAPPQPAHPTPA